MSSAASKPQPFEAFTYADGPAMLRMWADLKARTGLSGTPLVEEGASSWRGTLLGRNRYRFRIDTEAELLEVEASGRETPMPPRLLFAAELSDAGLAKAVTAICAAEQPEQAAFDLLKDTETLPRHERVSEAFARRIAEAVVRAR